MSNSQQYTFQLEPVYGLSGNQIAWVLLTRFVDDADIKHERNPARVAVFFIALVTDADLLILKGLVRITPFELDDSGPGYSSLIMMRSGIFACVKIDKAFFGCMAQAIYSTRNIIGMVFILMILIVNHGVRPAPPISAENTCAKKRI